MAAPVHHLPRPHALHAAAAPAHGHSRYLEIVLALASTVPMSPGFQDSALLQIIFGQLTRLHKAAYFADGCSNGDQ